MKWLRFAALALVAAATLSPAARALEKQPSAAYHGRREALGVRLQGGIAVLFAAPEPVLDFDPYRQDSNFYYLTGWNEPGAALLIAGPNGSGEGYKEILFLPTRNLRMEKYTGAKLDADTPGVAQATGVDAVEPMTELPAELNKLIAANRRLAYSLWTQPDSQPAKALVTFTATTLGMDAAPNAHDVTAPDHAAARSQGRMAKSICSRRPARLHRRAARDDARRQARRHRARHRRQDDRRRGSSRAASAPPTRPSSARASTPPRCTTPRTPAPSTMATSWSSMPRASTRCTPPTSPAPCPSTATSPRASAKSTTSSSARSRRPSTHLSPASPSINDRDRHDPNSLDTAAYNYINTHGKGLHGEPLGKYWLHGLGHMVGINVHDPADYPAVLKPGMVFTIEPGVYIPEEKIGVRIECDFLVGADGKLIDLDARPAAHRRRSRSRHAREVSDTPMDSDDPIAPSNSSR